MYIQSKLQDGWGRSKVQDIWNVFIPTNNERISGGRKVDGQIVVGDGYQYSYDRTRRLTEYHRGITATLGYDPDQVLYSVTRSDGQWVKSEINANFDLTQITNSQQERYTFGYTKEGWNASQGYYKNNTLKTVVTYSQFSARGLPGAQSTINFVDEDTTVKSFLVNLNRHS